MLLGLVLVPRPAVAFFFSVGNEDNGCPHTEALDAAIEAIGKPSVRWQDASTTGVEAFAAAYDELEAGGGAEDFAALGAEAFGTDGFGLLAGFFCMAFFGALALPLAPASAEAFVARLNSSTAFLAYFCNLACCFAHSLGNSSPLRMLVGCAVWPSASGGLLQGGFTAKSFMYLVVTKL